MIKKTIILMMMMCLVSLPISTYATQEILSDDVFGLLDSISKINEILPYDGEKMVTRKEFLEATTEILAPKDLGTSNISFTDVQASDTLYAKLKIAVGLGWINDGDTFRPTDLISANECIKICTIATGYGLKAELSGGYPSGYIKVARENGILSSIKNVGNEISAKTAYQFIYSTLKADILEQSNFGQTIDFAKTKDKNLLWEIYNIRKTKGILNCNEYACVRGSISSSEVGKIQINGVKYLVSGDFNNYLGYNVEGYYIDKDDTQTMVYVYPYDNETLIIPTKNASYDNLTITYEKNEKKVTEKLNKAFSYIYNGKEFLDYDSNNFIPKDCTLTLLDNNKDNKFDVVFVDEYYYMTASVVNKFDKSICGDGKNQPCITLSEDCSYSIYDDESGNIDFSQLSAGNLLGVKSSKDKKLIYIEVCHNAVSGVVTQIDNTKETIYIDDVKYETKNSFYKEYEKVLTVGTKMEFQLGKDKQIVGISDKETPLEYGYLIDAVVSDGISAQLKLKIYTKQGEFSIFPCSDKILLDGQSFTQEAVYKKLTSTIVSQLIKYSVNKDNKVDKIDLSQESKDISIVDNQNPYNNLTKNNFATSYNYRQQIFYPYFHVGGSLIFKIPTDLTDEESFAIGATFPDGDTTNVTPYDVCIDGSAKAIVYLSDNKSITNNDRTEIILVEKIVEAVDEKGETSKKIYGWQNGSYIEYYLDDKVEISRHNVKGEIKSGDILRISRINNKIVRAVLDFDGEEISPNTGEGVPSFNGKSTNLQYQAGKVYSFKNNFVYLSQEKNLDGTYNFDTKNLKLAKLPSVFAIYNQAKKVIYSGDLNYIKTYLNSSDEACYIVIKQSYMQSHFAVIYVEGENENK